MAEAASTLNRRALRAVQIFGAAVVVMRLILFIVLLDEYWAMRGVRNHVSTAREELESAAALAAQLSLVSTLVFVAFLAALAVFTFVAYRIVSRTNKQLRFNDWAASLLWFLPVWNIVHPLLVFRELHKALQFEPEDSRAAIVAWRLTVVALVLDFLGTVFEGIGPQPSVAALVLLVGTAVAVMTVAAVLLYLKTIAAISAALAVSPLAAPSES